MMKNFNNRKLCIVIVFTLLISLFTPVFAVNSITVKLDNQTLSFDVQPKVINDRILVPLRTIFEALGAIVEWQDDTKSVKSKKNDKIITMQIDMPYIEINGVKTALDVSPQIIDDRVLVPIRALSESFGANVQWNENNKEVVITTNKLIGDKKVNVYSKDGKMATISLSEIENWKSVGWYENFPYAGQEIWINSFYLFEGVYDIYNRKIKFDVGAVQEWNKCVIKWYDDSAWEKINEREKILKTVIFEYNGGEYKLPFGDLLRGKRKEISDDGKDQYDDFYAQIRWENPKLTFNISNSDWNKIQSTGFFKGMTKDEFTLLKGYKPNEINNIVDSYGTREQWIYKYAIGDKYIYYFRDNLLLSWEYVGF